MKSITQKEINATYPDIIDDLEEEIQRVKMFANDNGYHVGTSVYTIIRRYRDELKQLKEALRVNIT